MKAILYYIACVLSIGVLPIVAFWYPQVSTRFTKTKTSLRLCHFVLLKVRAPSTRTSRRR